MAAQFAQRSASDTGRAIVDLVRSTGVISRVELAERSGLTGASISRIVKRLLDDGLLVETGVGDATGGKRRTLLELNAGERFAVGITVDVAQLSYVLVDLRGEVVGELTSPGAGPTDPQVVVARMAAEAGRLLDQHGVTPARTTGIGVAIPGRLDAAGHSLRSSREATEWEQFALEPALEEATGLPVRLEHDYVCAALGEFWVGRIPAAEDFACFYAATGFGAGIVLGGEVYGGSSGNAGEVGHLVLDVDGPDCWCGGRGCLEAFAAPRTVVASALAGEGVAQQLGLSGDPVDLREDFARVALAAVGGDEACRALVERSARYVAAALLSLTNVLDLDRVVLSGPAFAQAGELYLKAAQDAVDRLAFLRGVHPVVVELSQLGQRSAAVGAATVALDSHLRSPDRRRTPVAGTKSSASGGNQVLLSID